MKCIRKESRLSQQDCETVRHIFYKWETFSKTGRHNTWDEFCINPAIVNDDSLSFMYCNDVMNHCWLKGYKVTASVCVPRLSVVSDEMILSHCQQHCYHPISITSVISVITVSHCCSTLGLHQTEVIPVSDPHHILILATNNSLVRGY